MTALDQVSVSANVGEYGRVYLPGGQRIAGRMRLLLSLAGRELGESMLDRVTQGSYSTSVGASAGTHAGGGAVDLSVVGWTAQRRWRVLTVLRRRGLIAWYRPPIPGLWPPHIHAIDRAAQDLSPPAAAQVTDFGRGLNGLADHGPDDGPDVHVPRFNYDRGLVEWHHGDPGQAHLVATANVPHRLDPRRHAETIRRLAALRVSVIAVQEVTDRDPELLAPDGWAWWRPPRERSAAVLWDSAVWRPVKRGTRRLHSRDWPEDRHVVWVLLENRFTRQRIRFGSCHLVAFKTSRPANAAEFRKQEARAAAWLSRGPLRVLAGDFNASPDGTWMPSMLRVGVHHQQLVGTGPDGQRIDHVWRPKPRPAARTVTTVDGASDHKALVCSLALRP